ncbi:MAG: sigma 54-interacting transcriptional regulator [Nitrococcus sp.]|nr:sigma 54-interacting transcriptional regulator [Nitrococcus sp.]
MDRFYELLLDVWREACRHIEIERSVPTIARLLAHRMPIHQLLVLAFDGRRPTVEVRAGLRVSPDAGSMVRALKPAEHRRLLAWARSGEIWKHAEGQAGDALRPMLLFQPHMEGGEWLAGPLRNERGPVGALLLRSHPIEGFEPLHVEMLQSLCEPFAAALENDHRLHEVNSLREAAEADKRSALSRLGRTALSDSIIGENGGLKPVMERVALVARTNIPVLLLGETGTGKEVIARALHEQSPRHEGPFIRVNCGAIPPDLIDSELFGHERGAFTGAASTRRGWFERADAGTLLLDEAGELPPAAQVRLLRVLQEHAFERVGGEQPIRVDVRIVAATHRNLVELVQNGRFREDLWYRIAGMPIILPPLRERHEDIPALVEHFAGRAARHFGLKPQRPSAGELSLLTAYHWPGNVRELGAVIDRAAILGDGERLEIAKALGVMPNAAMKPLPPAAQPSQSNTLSPSADVVSLDAAMRHHIEGALPATHGRIEGAHGAAKMLLINPHTLRARMRKLGIDWKRFRSPGTRPAPG